MYKTTLSDVNEEWSGKRLGSAREMKRYYSERRLKPKSSKEIDLGDQKPRIVFFFFVCTQVDNDTDTLHNIKY